MSDEKLDDKQQLDKIENGLKNDSKSSGLGTSIEVEKNLSQSAEDQSNDEMQTAESSVYNSTTSSPRIKHSAAPKHLRRRAVTSSDSSDKDESNFIGPQLPPTSQDVQEQDVEEMSIGNRDASDSSINSSSDDDEKKSIFSAMSGGIDSYLPPIVIPKSATAPPLVKNKIECRKNMRKRGHVSDELDKIEKKSKSSESPDNIDLAECSVKLSSEYSTDEVVPSTSKQQLNRKPAEPLIYPTWNITKQLYYRQFGIHDLRWPDQRTRAQKPGFAFKINAMGSHWAVSRLQLKYTLDEHEGCVNCVGWNQFGTRLVSGSDDTKICIWDWQNERVVNSFDSAHRLNIFQVKYLPFDESHIVSCARDGMVRLAELSESGLKCKATKPLVKHLGAVHKLTLPGGEPHIVLSCGEDAIVNQIDVREPPNGVKKILRMYDNFERKVAIYSIHSHPNQPQYFVTSGRDRYIRVYDRRYLSSTLSDEDDKKKKKKQDSVAIYSPHKLEKAHHCPHVTCAVYNYNGTELLGSYNDDDLYVFDTTHSTGADAVASFRGHRNSATVKGCTFFGAHSEFVVSGSDDGYLYFWDRKTQHIVHYLFADSGGVVNVIETHPSAIYLATSGLDNDVKVWSPIANKHEFDVKELHNLTKTNRKNRDRERRHPDPDSDMLYFMMRHIMEQRRRRHRARVQRRQMRQQQREEAIARGESVPNETGDDTDSSTNDDDDASGWTTSSSEERALERAAERAEEAANEASRIPRFTITGGVLSQSGGVQILRTPQSRPDDDSNDEQTSSNRCNQQ